jgi:hypothetical protein
MILGDTYLSNDQETDLFGKYFHGVYVRDDSQEGFVVDYREGNCGAGHFGFRHAKRH